MKSNRRRVLKIIVLLLAVTYGADLSGQEAPKPPAPNQLEADWWAYFAPAESLKEGELQRRIDLTVSGLKPSPEAGRLKLNLDRFAKLQTPESTPEKTSEIQLEASYTVDSALERFRSWWKLNGDYTTGKSEMEWQESLLTQDKIQQTQMRGEYLNLAEDDPTRYDTGLDLMIKRSGIEIRTRELMLREKDLETKAAKLAGMKDELDVIPERLLPQADALAKWKQRLEESKKLEEETVKSIAVAEKEAASIRSKTEIPAAIEARRTILRRTRGHLEIALAELGQTKASLAMTMINAKTLPKPEIATIKSELGKHRTVAAELSDLIKENGQTIQRIRNATNEQQSTAAGDDTLIKFNGETLAMVDEVEKLQRQLVLESGEARFLAGLLQERLYEIGGWVGKASNKTRVFGAGLLDQGKNLLRHPIFEVNETPVNGLGLLRVLLILTVSWWVSKLSRKGLDRFGAKQKRVSKTSLYTVERLLHYVILSLGILFALSALGLDLTKLALFASALGIGLGFGLQNMVSNFVAGLIVLFEKSLNVGDFVELQSGVTGEVREINMRSTLITTNDNVDMLIPNSEFVSGQVTNWTLREAHRRIRIPFGVAYGTDKNLVREAGLEAAARTQWTLSGVARRQPQVWLVGFGDSSLDFELVVWLTPEAVKRPAAVQADFLWEIETSLGQHGIEIPFPQRDLHIRSGLLPVQPIKGDMKKD